MTAPAQVSTELAVRSSRVPRVQRGVAYVRRTLLPPPVGDFQRTRMWGSFAVVAGLVGGCWLFTGGLLWALLIVVVAVPMVVLPALLVVGMLTKSEEAGA